MLISLKMKVELLVNNQSIPDCDCEQQKNS